MGLKRLLIILYMHQWQTVISMNIELKNK